MDITKCQGTGCSMKESCYRFTAPASEYRQAWFMQVPLEFIENIAHGITPYCQHYWNNKDYTK